MSLEIAPPMTDPDSLERIKSDMWELLERHLVPLQLAVREPGFSDMPEAYFKVQGAIDFMQTVLDPAVRNWAARIEALIPSKAEREFLEAAMAHGDRGCADGDAEFMPAYRALLAERGK